MSSVVFIYSPLHLIEDPGTVLGIGVVDVRKARCLWEGQKFWKYRDA